MKMKKIYRMLLAIVLMGTMTTAEAQTNGFNRLKNVDTQHVANLAGGMHFAPDVTMDEAHALPGTVAYAAFEDNKVTQLSAQGIDVVNGSSRGYSAPAGIPEEVKTVLIEANTMIDMAKRQILPAVASYAAALSSDIAAKRSVSEPLSCRYEVRTAAALSRRTL